jgi:hypothetical protein
MGICESLGINSIAIRPISCCFVISTRGDLREEFSMADEAFALSPISARAALPSEEDYAAISEAFMETSRGRWFLTEYAKRNRNADTSMVLDAVARIEQSLAAQKEEALQRDLAAQQLAAAAAAGTDLTEALTAIRSAVEAAQASVAEALALEQKLAPIRKGARVIREISWRLREIGNDGRICDLIDSQVSVIEAGAAEISSVEARAALDAAFASIEDCLAELGDDEAPAPVAEAAAASPSPATQETAPAAAMADTVEVAPAQRAADAPTTSFAAEAELAEAEAALADTEAAEADGAMEPAEAIDEGAADAHDEALLDMIAMEMGAPDPFDGDEMAEPFAANTHLAEPAPVEPATVAQAPEPVMTTVQAPAELRPQPTAQATVQATAQAAPEASLEISLGSSIIASGIVRKPAVAANDPLAPIRRMSQAEKIAFFS